MPDLLAEGGSGYHFFRRAAEKVGADALRGGSQSRVNPSPLPPGIIDRNIAILFD